MKIADYLLILGAGLALYNVLSFYQKYEQQQADFARMQLEANCKIEIAKANSNPINSIENYELCKGRFGR